MDSPNIGESMKVWCLKAPYDCMSNKVVTPHILNSFFYHHYLAVENYFFSLGYRSAEFEYCNTTNCLVEGVDVKNSAYKITRKFPAKKEYLKAFGGRNRNSGVYFLRELTADEADKFCSITVRSGNKLSKQSAQAIENKSVDQLSEIQGKFYKKYSLIFAQYLPSIDSLDHYNALPPSECWLKYKSKKYIFNPKGD